MKILNFGVMPSPIKESMETRVLDVPPWALPLLLDLMSNAANLPANAIASRVDKLVLIASELDMQPDGFDCIALDASNALLTLPLGKALIAAGFTVYSE